ncbi:MAG: glycosyl hydrolase 53 family protein [Bacteroidaceae bacterium]|nr:glycosyl hydrolase 53 family protein [Bacteroidaceae bacterium]
MMKLKYLFLASIVCMGLVACGDDEPIKPDPEKEQTEPTNPEDDPNKPVDNPEETKKLAKGADISWCTQMEDKGHKFYGFSSREPKECTAIMKELGCNAIRLRVLVNPTDGYYGKEDVLKKAIRVRDLGLDLMIDFYYSDTFNLPYSATLAEPVSQTIPAEWAEHDYDQLCTDVYNHTTEVLKLLKDNNINVKWVQIGNETSNGLLYPIGQADEYHYPTHYRGFIEKGASAARAVYPDVLIVVHLPNAYDQSLYKSNLRMLNSESYDIVGMSLFPNAAKGQTYYTGDTNAKVTIQSETQAIQDAFSNIDFVYKTFEKPCMIVECGLQVHYEIASTNYMNDIMARAKENVNCLGVFYWEPESYEGWMNYDKGAFLSNGHPTQILNSFE